jgi:phosphomevalonate kinase
VIIVASAPGKVVVSGEYAVLGGAPAVVMAVNRRCSARIESEGHGWQFISRGFEGGSTHGRRDLLGGANVSADDPARIAQHILKVAAFGALPDDLKITLDSRAAYEHGAKIGIGSSAAVCVALSAALIRLAGAGDVAALADAAHRALQGGRGSGLDVATACRGGVVEFQAGQAVRRAWPKALRYCFIWSGASAETTAQISRFERGAAQLPAFADLCAAAAAVTRATPAHFMRELAAYTNALRAFDDAARLGIFSAAHVQIAAIATDHDVVYKPCGAGGGDIGAAFATDAGTLADFVTTVAAAGFRLIDMELDEHGVLVDIAG